MKRLLIISLLFVSFTGFGQIQTLNNLVKSNNPNSTLTGRALDGGLSWTASGTDTYTVNIGLGVTALTAGDKLGIFFTNANLTTSPTLNINGIGALPVVNAAGGALSAGDLHGIKQLYYDGTSLRVIGGSTGGGSSSAAWGDITGTLADQTDLQSALDAKAPTSRTLSTTAPLSGGGDLSGNRTLSIGDAAADGSTKGAASFTASDFNATSGNIAIDYTNGQAASASLKGFLSSTDWNNFNNKPEPFVETGVAYVDSLGNNATAALGRPDKPFQTIDAALDAGAAVKYLKVKIGLGSFTAPDSAKLRGNLFLEGSGKPGYNNHVTQTAFATVTITDPTALKGGTILKGTLVFRNQKGNNVRLRDLGVDTGSAFVTGGGTESNQIVFLSSHLTTPWLLMKNIVIQNVTTLGRTAASSFHGIQIENGFKPIIENCDTYFSTHGIVLKTYGGIVNNVRCNFHTLNAVIFKTDTYALGWLQQLTNFEIQGGGGVHVHIGSGTSTGGLAVLISNGKMRSPTYGILVESSTASMVHYSQINNVQIYGSSGIGIDLQNTQSSLVYNNHILAASTGIRVTASSTNTYCHVYNNFVEACTTGYNITGGASGNAFAFNNAARNNTTGYTWGTNVFGRGNTGDINATFSTGTIVYQETARAFFGTSSGSPTALVHINSGSTTLAPLKIASGSLLTTPEVSAIEFLTDKWYGTITTGAARKEFTLNDAALTSGRVPFATTNGRITDDADLTFSGTELKTAALATAYVAKTALYTLTASDYTVEVTSGTHTQTLPTAVGITGRVYVITNSGAGVVTVATTSSQTFVNVTATPTTLTLNQFETAMVQSNGANWLRIN